MAPRLRLPLLAVAMAAALTALAPPARALVGDSPCAIATSTGPISPISGQPSDIVVIGPSGSQGVAVWRRFGADSVCAGAALPQNARKWRALVVDSTGVVATVNNQASRAAALAIVWKRTSVKPPPVVVEPTPAPLTRDSLLGWPVRRVLDSIALSAAMRTTLRMFAAAAVPALDALAATEGVRWEGNYYDRALSLYALCSATGLQRLCARADSQAVAYRDTYLAATSPPYSPSAHWALLEGVTIHAERTGDPASRTAVAASANQLWVGHVNAHLGHWDTDPRVDARTLGDQLLAARLSAPDVPASGYRSDPTWAAHADSVLVRLLARQRADGAWDYGAWLCHAQLNYQAALLHDALIMAHGSPAIPAARRPAIVDAVRRSAAYLWTTQRRGGEGFSYASGSCTTPVGQLDPGPAGDLTGLYAGAWTWLTEQTGDPVWAARGDTLAAEGVAGAYWPGTKQTNQALYLWRHFGRR